jgi:hypothetical protein
MGFPIQKGVSNCEQKKIVSMKNNAKERDIGKSADDFLKRVSPLFDEYPHEKVGRGQTLRYERFPRALAPYFINKLYFFNF